MGHNEIEKGRPWQVPAFPLTDSLHSHASEKHFKDNVSHFECQSLFDMFSEGCPGPPLPSGDKPGEDGVQVAPLPCLNSNKGAEPDIINKMQLLCQELFSPYRQKSAFALLDNAKRFVALFGLEYVGFLTLTFPDNVVDHREAYRRFKSLSKHFLSVVFGEYLLVKERQVRGAWHFHLLVQCYRDIRTGFKFEECFPGVRSGRRPRYSSASLYLRNLWQSLRSELPKYGFGRAELAPVKSNDEGIAYYIGKYLEANLENNLEYGANLTKGVRLTSASRGWPVSSPKFAWNTAGGKLWREKLAALAKALGIESSSQFRERYGERWSWLLGQLFVDTDPRDMVPHDHKIDEHGAVVPDLHKLAKIMMHDYEASRCAHRVFRRRLSHAKNGLALSRGYVQYVVDRNAWLEIPDEQVPF